MTETADGPAPRPAASSAVPSSAHVSGLAAGTGPASVGTGFVIVGAAICFLISLRQTLTIPILLTLTRVADFSDAVGATWATFLPLIVGAACSPIMARLSDLYGRRRILVICLVIAFIGSVIGPLGVGRTAETWTVLIGRALQGVGLATIPVVLAAAREMLSPRRMITSLAIFGGALGMGILLGAPVGEVIYQVAGWKVMFWGNAVVMAVLAASVMAVMPAQRPRIHPRFDVRGALLLPPAIVILLAVTLQAPTWGHRSPITLTTVAIGLVLLAVWATTALRTRTPLVNVRSFRHPSVVFAHLASFALGWILLTNTLLVAIQVQEENIASGRAWAPEATFLVTLPVVAALLFVGPCAAVIAQRFGPKTLLVTGGVLALAGFVLRVYASPTAVLGTVWATFIAIGATLATTAIPMLLNIISSGPRVGALNGMNWMLRLAGMTIGGATVLDIATNFTIEAGGTSSPTWQAMWLVLVSSALVTVLLVLCAVLLPLPRRTKAAPPRR